MKNPNIIGCYPAPIYHDAPNYYGPVSEPGHMVLVAIQRSQIDRGVSRVGQMQLMVFPPLEVEGPVFTPGEETVVATSPLRGPVLRPSELAFRVLPHSMDPYPQQTNGPLPRTISGALVNEGPEEFPNDSAAGRFKFTDVPAARQLFADPGLLRILRLGDFEAQLRPQLRYPERLQESHQLPCYVQVFEISRPRPVEEVTSFLSSPGLAYQLGVLEEPETAKLLLSDLPQSVRRQVRRAPGLLLPGDRIFRLQVIRDPSATSAGSQTTNQFAPVDVATPSKPLKRSIPETYLSPWEFERTREEAMRELRSESSGTLRNLWQTIWAWRKRHEIRNWRSLLIGKSADDQLWGVPPPKSVLNDPAVRQWASRTLALAGYDSDVMLREWEIFWRRKGF